MGMAKKSRQTDANDHIVDGFYDAACGEISWSQALDRYADRFPSLKFALCGYEGRLDGATVVAHSNYDRSYLRSYETYYYQCNPWADLLLVAPPAPNVSWAHDWVPFEGLKDTEFYNDFIRPQDDVATGFASTLFRDKDRFMVLAANVAFKHLEDAQGAAKAFEVVGPHLRRSFELYRRLEGKQLLNTAMEQALNSLRAAVFVVDEQTKVVFSNKEAEELENRSDIVRVGSDRCLRFAPNNDEAAIAKHLYECTRFSALPSDLFLRLQTRLGHPFVLFIAPVPGGESGASALHPSPSAWGKRYFLVFLIDLRAEPQSDLDVLSNMLGITAAEALLAQALLNDKSIKDYADERGISSHTARAQLKSVMAKTGTHRQAELVNLLSRTLTALRLGEE